MDLGTPFVPLRDCVIPVSSEALPCKISRYKYAGHPFQQTFGWVGLTPTGNWSSSSLAFAISIGSCSSVVSYLLLNFLLYSHAMVPYGFPLQVSELTAVVLHSTTDFFEACVTP